MMSGTKCIRKQSKIAFISYREGKSPRCGVLGVEPLGEGGVAKSKIECRGKAFPPIILGIMSVACAILALGDVVCTWSDQSQTYICSGEGSQVVIGGGGPSGGSPVVTNDIGSCTNCSAISPLALAYLADDLDTMRGLIYDETGYILDKCSDIRDDLEAKVDEIDTFQTLQGGSALGSDSSPIWITASNYMYTANNAQSAAMLSVYNNTSLSSTAKVPRRTAAVGAANGVYYYANNSVRPALNNALGNLYDIESGVNFIRGGTATGLGGGGIEGIVTDMRAGAVACRNCGDGDGGDGCGGTNTTNWCTFEQGEAMKSLLSEMSNYLASCSAQLVNISNYTYQTWQTIRSGLFTEYNAIPRQSQLGDWQTVYLDGNETNWGYQPSNILARIELLLYGMSGVGTNDTIFTEGGTESTEVLDNIDNTTDEVDNQLRAISTDADSTSAESLGQALISFFGEFTLSGDRYSESTELWPSSYFRIGQDEYEIPQLTPGSGFQYLNSMQSFSRVFFTVGYWVLGAFLVFRFWAWFAEKAAIMSKWAVEFLTSLFSS